MGEREYIIKCLIIWFTFIFLTLNSSMIGCIVYQKTMADKCLAKADTAADYRACGLPTSESKEHK